jgi:plastocyanin
MTTDDTKPDDGEAQAEDVPVSESDANIVDAEPGDAAHPYRERYLVPFLFPLVIVLGIVIFVLNVSRIFISSVGSAAVIIAVVMTLLILFGATALSAAPSMRTSSISLIVVGSLLVVTTIGWLNVGHAEDHGGEEVVLGDPVGAIKIDAITSSLSFDPNAADLPADPANAVSVIEITLEDREAGSHTLAFDDPEVVWNVPEVSGAGEKITEKAGFPQAGEFSFYCTIPGHREAGMEGTLTVTPDVEPQPVPSGETPPAS